MAVVLERQGEIALFRRSQQLNHDKGLWHCITGFVEQGASPEKQAAQEVLEEAGLAPSQLINFRAGPSLELVDQLGDPWRVHTFAAEASDSALTINWEHDAYRWIAPSDISGLTHRVSWLDRVLEATGHRSG